MLRVIIQNLLLLALPTALYFAYTAVARSRAAAAGQVKPGWEQGPWFWLAVAGVGLMALSLASLALLGDHETTGVYIPPHVEGGKIIPGRLK